MTAEESEADFFELVEDAIAAIPEPFASQLDSVAVVVDDVAPADNQASARAVGQ